MAQRELLERLVARLHGSCPADGEAAGWQSALAQKQSYAAALLSSTLSPSLPQHAELVQFVEAALQGDAAQPAALDRFRALERELRQSRSMAPDMQSSLLYLLYSLRNGKRPQYQRPVLSQSKVAGAPPVKRQPSRDQALLEPATVPKESVAEPASEVSEEALVADLLFPLQGLNGRWLCFDAQVGGWTLPAGSVGMALNRPGCRTVERLATQAGLALRCVEAALRRTTRGGLVEQALGAVLREELRQYTKHLAALESQIARAACSPQPFSVRRVLVWARPVLARLRLLVGLIETGHGLHGGALLSQLAMHLQQGDEYAQHFMTRNVHHVWYPVRAMAWAWAARGELQDPYKEFWVVEDEDTPHERLWSDKYRVCWELVPAFVGPALAEQVLLAGKTLQFIRECCSDKQWVQDWTARQAQRGGGMVHIDSPDKRNDSLRSDLSELGALVHSNLQTASARLMQLMRDRHRLAQVCLDLKRFMLLGQGDVVQGVLEMAQQSLDQPAHSLHEPSLHLLVQSAVRAAQLSDEAHVLQILRTRVEQSSPQKTGWEVFSLDLEVKSPLNAVIPEQALNLYRRLFRFLWRLKRLEFALASLWKQHTKLTQRRELRDLPVLEPVLLQAHLLRNEMTQLVRNLLNYVMCEVLEAAWQELEIKLAEAQDLDALIRAHDAYLTTLMEKSLLAAPTYAILSHLQRLLALVLHYAKGQASLYNEVTVEVVRRERARQEARQRSLRGGWGVLAPSEAAEAERARDIEAGLVAQCSREVDNTSKDFRGLVLGFLELLEDNANSTTESGSAAAEGTPHIPERVRQSMTFLRFRLDFNRFYSHKQQAQHNTQQTSTTMCTPLHSGGNPTEFKVKERVRQNRPAIRWKSNLICISSRAGGPGVMQHCSIRCLTFLLVGLLAGASQWRHCGVVLAHAPVGDSRALRST
eukprot:g71851.t1